MELSEILSNWDIAMDVTPVPPAAGNQNCIWQVGVDFILKSYESADIPAKSNLIAKALAKEGIPVALPVETVTGDELLSANGRYYCLFPKLPGKHIEDWFAGDYLNTGRRAGGAIGRLHLAFGKCELEVRDNDLFRELREWALPEIRKHGMEMPEIDFPINHSLSSGIIHRDIHGGNLLFTGDELSGYIDFDLSQRNIRIFDPCYMGTGILSGIIDQPDKLALWLGLFASVLSGYDKHCPLTDEERRALPHVLCGIVCIFIAYYAGKDMPDQAQSNVRMLNWLIENT